MLVSAADTASEDPVCGLTNSEKLRVCASVMGSSDFVERVKFRTIYGCEKKKVSFQTENANKEANVDYYEWMLTCSVDPVTLAWSTYHVSRAYHSHHAIVYAADYRNYYLTQRCEYYIYNINANISLIIENDGHRPPPNLIDLLEDTRL